MSIILKLECPKCRNIFSETIKQEFKINQHLFDDYECEFCGEEKEPILLKLEIIEEESI